jgi:small subunit ribosomal protein S6
MFSRKEKQVRVYELLFIVIPTEPDEAVDALVEQLRTVAEERGATVSKVDRIGRRKLAYEIRVSPTTYTDGNYVVMTLEGTGSEIAELERRLRVTETVIRHMTVRIDEDLKRAEKFKAKRAARQAAGGGRSRGERGSSEAEVFADADESETSEEEVS